MYSLRLDASGNVFSTHCNMQHLTGDTEPEPVRPGGCHLADCWNIVRCSYTERIAGRRNCQLIHINGYDMHVYLSSDIQATPDLSRFLLCCSLEVTTFWSWNWFRPLDYVTVTSEDFTRVIWCDVRYEIMKLCLYGHHVTETWTLKIMLWENQSWLFITFLLIWDSLICFKGP